MTIEEVQLPAARSRYIDYVAWLYQEYGYKVDPAAAQVAVTRYHDYQRSDRNAARNSERKEKIAAANLSRAEEREAKKINAAERLARREERAKARAERESAKSDKAQKQKYEKKEKSAAEASKPKKQKKEEGQDSETIANTLVFEGPDNAVGLVDFKSEGQARITE